MSALDRLQDFSARATKSGDTGVFDTKTPAGAFLQRVHNEGYKMYEPCYVLKAEHMVDESTLSGDNLAAYHAALEISVEAYEAFNDEFKEMYEPSTRFTELHDVLTTDGNQIVNAVAGSGKALLNGTGVLTKWGYRPIELLHTNDLVFGEDGKLHRVLGVFPQGEADAYEVTFSDGNKIVCSGNHLWQVNIVVEDETKVMTTEDILSDVQLHVKGQGYNCRIPTTCALDFGFSPELKIAPYIMGYLLASMWYSEKNLVVTVPVPYDKNKFINELRRTYIDALHLSPVHDVITIECPDLTGCLEMYGIFGVQHESRFIPKDYLFANKSARLDLLRGILDAESDRMGGKDCLMFSSELFANDFAFLCESLGLIPEVVVESGMYCVYITPSSFCADYVAQCGSDDEVLSRIHESSRRYISAVRKLDVKREMTCITIDSPSHLFLTEHCIATHNTTMLVFKILHDIVTGRCMTMKELDNGMTVRTANKVWVCTFLRTGAAELEAALTKWQTKFGYSQTASTLSFSTMDAEFKRCLNAMGVATPLDGGGKLYSCLVKAIDSCNIKRDGYNLAKEDYNIIGGIVDYYRGRLDDQRYRHPACDTYELTPSILDLLVKQFAALRQQAGIMDFAEIMELLYKYLYVTPNPQVQEFVANRYNFIYIDEFQDTSQMAYAILKFYARGKLWLNRGGPLPNDTPAGLFTGHETLGKLVVVGDTAQCVMPDTQISVAEGYSVPAEEISKGDQIMAIIGRDRLGYVTVDEVIKKHYSGNICNISLSNGVVLRVTEDHKCFVRPQTDITNADIELCMFGGNDMMSDLTIKLRNGDAFNRQSYDVDALEALMHDAIIKFDEQGHIPVIQRTALLYLGQKYKIMGASDVSFGDVLCVFNKETGKLDQVVVMGVTTERYDGLVYDFNIFDVHNFVADGVVVHNCIYSFRGSDSTILAHRVAEDFNPVISSLSVNWRCPRNILDPVVPSIHKNRDSTSQVIKAAKDGGELFAFSFSNYQQMINQLKLDIQKDMDDGLSVAILCRTNFDGLIPSVVLEQDGRFNFSVSGENMTMNSPLPKKLIGMTSLFTERATTAVKNSLMEFAGRTNGWAVKNLIDILKQNNKSFWDIPEEDIRYSCPVLVDLYRDIKPLLTVNGVRSKEREIEALEVIYFKMMRDVYGGDSAYCESARAYLETLIFIIRQGNFKSVYDFLEEIEYLNDKLNGRIKKNKAYVRIATVHEFKGKEADSVYVWNDNDGVFPYSKCDMNVEDDVAEERRVHYIACTRARVREHIYSMAGRVGLFAREMDIKFTNPTPVQARLPKK